MDKTALGIVNNILGELRSIKGLIRDTVYIPREEVTKPDQANQSEKEGGEKPPVSSKFLQWLRKWKVAMEYIGAFVVLAYTIVTYCTLNTIKESNRLASQSVSMSQRAYVSIGRKDGTVADFVVPQDPNMNAAIVIYFQNSGHLPAKFTWGTMSILLAKGTKTQRTGLTFTHPYQGGLNRIRDKKTGSIAQIGQSSVIAGDSVFVAQLASISQKDLAELPVNNLGLLITGQFEFCDEIGTHSIREFSIAYQSHAPSSSLSFNTTSEFESQIPPLPKATETNEHLEPCQNRYDGDPNKGK